MYLKDVLTFTRILSLTEGHCNTEWFIESKDWDHVSVIENFTW